MPDYGLDLTNRHFTYTRGEILMIGSWIKLDGEIDPCLALLRKDRELEFVPCIIPLAAGWKWELDRGDPPHCAKMAIEFLQTLGFEVTQQAVKQLVFFVHDNIGELYSIPPSKQLDEHVSPMLEAVIRNRNTGRTREELI